MKHKSLIVIVTVVLMLLAAMPAAAIWQGDLVPPLMVPSLMKRSASPESSPHGP